MIKLFYKQFFSPCYRVYDSGKDKPLKTLKYHRGIWVANFGKLMTILNAKGKRGWELAIIIPDKTRFYLILKQREGQPLKTWQYEGMWVANYKNLMAISRCRARESGWELATTISHQNRFFLIFKRKPTE